MTALDVFVAHAVSYSDLHDETQNIVVPVRLADIRALVSEANDAEQGDD